MQGNVVRLNARMARDLARVPAQRLASRIRSRCIGSSRRSRKRPKAEVAPRLVIQGREGQVVVEVTVSWYVRSCLDAAYMGNRAAGASALRELLSSRGATGPQCFLEAPLFLCEPPDADQTYKSTPA